MEEAMSSQRERELWTQYIEDRQRQRNQTARKPRAKRVKGPTPEELEQALDDLVSEAERLDTRGDSPMDTERRGATSPTKKRLLLNASRECPLVPPFGKKSCDINKRLNSERFRSGPRTCRLLCGRLTVRETVHRAVGRAGHNWWRPRGEEAPMC